MFLLLMQQDANIKSNIEFVGRVLGFCKDFGPRPAFCN
jgi:hypothetical protein